MVFFFIFKPQIQVDLQNRLFAYVQLHLQIINKHCQNIYLFVCSFQQFSNRILNPGESFTLRSGIKVLLPQGHVLPTQIDNPIHGTNVFICIRSHTPGERILKLIPELLNAKRKPFFPTSLPYGTSKKKHTNKTTPQHRKSVQLV